jgi:hypothetical protein
MKYEERLPPRKVSESLDRTYGLRVSPATVLDITRRVARWLRPEYERILRRIRAAGVVYVDEAGAKGDGRRFWIWVFTTSTDSLIVIRKSRGKKVLGEILGEGFDGVVVCDGWRSYGSFTGRLQRCWAYLLREAEYLAERIDEAVPLWEALRDLFGGLRCWAVDKPPPRRERCWRGRRGFWWGTGRGGVTGPLRWGGSPSRWGAGWVTGSPFSPCPALDSRMIGRGGLFGRVWCRGGSWAVSGMVRAPVSTGR